MFQLWFLILMSPWPRLCPAVISGLERKIVLLQDNFEECDNLVGGLSAIVRQELGSGNANSFSYRDIDVQDFDIKR